MEEEHRKKQAGRGIKSIQKFSCYDAGIGRVAEERLQQYVDAMERARAAGPSGESGGLPAASFAL